MRVFASTCLLLLLQAVTAHSDTVNFSGEQAVVSAYKKMEQADRQGDGQLWLSLRNRQTLDSMDAALKDTIRKGGRSRPKVLYDPIATRVSNNRAIILGKVDDPDSASVQYDAVLFVVEEGAWKVAREQWSEKPYDPFLLYGLLEPEDGAFIRQGAPWKGIPYAAVNTQLVRKEEVSWKVQATMDESFAYVRFEASAAVPAPGAKVAPDLAKTGKTGGPPSPPPLRFKTPAEYSFSVSALVSSVEVPTGKGKTTTRYSVAYSLFVKNAAGDSVFETTLGDGSANRLFGVHDRFIDVKIPLGGLGVNPTVNPRFDLEESDSVMLILPYHVDPFASRN